MISIYWQFLETGVEKIGFKKLLAELLLSAKIIDKDTIGQLVVHLNNGGVTDVYLNRKVIG